MQGKNRKQLLSLSNRMDVKNYKKNSPIECKVKILTVINKMQSITIVLSLVNKMQDKINMLSLVIRRQCHPHPPKNSYNWLKECWLKT